MPDQQSQITCSGQRLTAKQSQLNTFEPAALGCWMEVTLLDNGQLLPPAETCQFIDFDHPLSTGSGRASAHDDLTAVLPISSIRNASYTIGYMTVERCGMFLATGQLRYGAVVGG